MHTLHAERVHAALHVLEDLDIPEDADVLLEGDHALVVAGLGLDEPRPVLPGPGVLQGQVTVVGAAHVAEPGAVGAVRPVDGVHLGVDGDLGAGGSQPLPVGVD